MPSLLRSRLAVAACSLLACALLAPGAASAAAGDSGPLSPELAQLAAPAVVAKAAPAQSAALGFPAEGPGSLLREGDRVIVEAHFEAGALARVEALRAAGAKVLTASSRYQTVALAVEPEDLAAVSAVPGVSAVVASRAPVFYGAEEGAHTAAVASNGLCEGGSVISQGLEQLNVPAARAAFNARGAGETIGVISDSFNSATTSIEGGPLASNAHDDEVSNDLPGPASTCSGQQAPVRVLLEAPASESRTDEGRAMLQIVHDLAPHAQLAFASADYGELAFAHSIEQLALPVVAGGAGANVIVDDVGYFTEPYFQEGPVGEAIQKVTAEGVTYLTAAGNDNLIEKAAGEHEIASWERSEFKDTPCPNVVKPEVGEAAANCMNFSPTGTDSTFEITVEPDSTLIVDLQWAEAWYGVKTDLDAYLLNEAETQILASNPINNINQGVEIGSPPQPTELIGWENETAANAKVKLVINRCIHNCNSGASLTTKPRLKFQLLEDGRGVSSTEYKESSKVNGIVMGPTIYGHAGSPAAITLGAVRYSESASAPKEPERYSSRGPVTHYFAPVSGITPAAELTSAEVIEKPNLTATDCASTTFFAQRQGFSDGLFHFCGTSEAGPHAAAIAALMKQTAPFASPASIVAKMEASATKYKPPGTFNRPEAVGAGLLNAAAAIIALGGSRVEDPPSFVVPSLTEEAAAPAPVVKITKGPKSPGKESRPTFEFSSTRPVTFACQIDGGPPQACASPYLVPTKLADGTHGFAVTGTDAQGRSGSSGVYAFTIDTKAPKVTIVRHPKKVVRTKKRNIVGRFKLRSNEAPVTFYCEIDKEPLRICPKSFHRRFTPGSHVLKVRAMDQAGNLAAKWTSYRFRVTQVGRRSHRNGG